MRALVRSSCNFLWIAAFLIMPVLSEDSCEGSSCQPACICVPKLKCLPNLAIFARQMDSSPKCKNNGLVCCPPSQIKENTEIKKVNKPRPNPIHISQEPNPLTSPLTPILIPNTPKDACGRKNLRPTLRILGNTESEFGEFPWQAAILMRNYSYICGGALIHSKWVITAAHSILGIERKKLLVRLGEHNANDPHEPGYEETIVSKVIYHPQFNEKTLQNDIALLKLAPPAEMNSYIGTVCLPPPLEFLGKTCTVAGWGRNKEGGSFSPILKKISVPIVDNKKCESMLRKSTELGPDFKLDFNFICAGDRGKDSCKGDGGSPLVCEIAGEFFAVGLVSWGIGCGGDYPGVYTRVTQYNNWIESEINKWP